jgi:hypothetical protein
MLNMKRMTRVSLAVVVLLITSIIAAGTVWGYSALRKVDATANDNIKIYYDGDLKTFTDTDGSKISPVIINGRTYLPLRAISDLVGVGVEWDGTTQSIYLSSESGNNTSTPKPQTSPTPNNTSKPSNTTSKNAGTLEDPIKLGDTYSWSAREKYIDTYASADYSFTVKNVKPITLDDVESLGIRYGSNAVHFDFVMITAEVKVSNGKIESGEEFMYLPFARDIWGSKTSTGMSIIGGTDYGFEGSLMDNCRATVEDSNGFIKKLKAGEVCEFSYSGNIILPLTKDAENYLVILKDGSLDYYDSFAYFRLK